MFSKSHFDALQKTATTLLEEDPGGHVIIVGPHGTGKMSVARLALNYTATK